MTLDHLVIWFAQNRDGLLLGIGIGIALVAVMLLLRGIGRSLIDRDPHGLSWRMVVGRILAKTTMLFMVFAAADTVATYADLPHRAAHLIDIGFIVAFALQGAIWGRELILGLIGRRVAEDNGASSLGNAMAIIRVLVSVALFAIAGILILDNLGVNVTALVAGLGIGGIAIGLAAQGIFSDLFAALSILFDKPFKKGDTIRYDASTGTVERIGLKTTRLRSLTGEQLIMANTKLLEREIHNLAEASIRRTTLYFAVANETSSDQLDQLASLAETAVSSRKGCKIVRCVASGVGGGAIGFELVYDDKALDNNRSAENRSAILLDLIQRLRTDGVEMVRASEIAPPLAPF
jgi:small-conductance mechanosensitive channel